MQDRLKFLTFSALLLVLAGGCATAEGLGAGMATEPAPAAPVAQTAPVEAVQPPAPADFTSGTVVETMDSGGYTYLCLENGGQKRWAAVPKTEVKVGQEVQLAQGTEMGSYTSKTLNRTFDSIYFCGGLVSASGGSPHAQEAPAQNAPTASGMPPGHGMPGMSAGKKMFGGGGGAAEAVSGKVVETFDAGGYTYCAVEKDGQTTWVAAPPVKLAVGDTVTFNPGMPMSNFTSKSINRTFDVIIFTNGVAAPQ